MPSDIPWTHIAGRLGIPGPAGDAALQTLAKVVSGDDPYALECAEALAATTPTLQSPTARSIALDLASRRPDSAIVRQAALDLANDESRDVRSSVAAILRGNPNDAAARSALFALMQDPDGGVAATAIGTLGDLLSAQEQDVSSVAVFLIADSEARRDTLDLLDRMERAVHVLQDLGLDEAQNQIVETILLPAILELKNLLSLPVESPAVTDDARSTSRFRLGSLAGAAKALALTVSSLGEADEAIENLRSGAEAIGDVLAYLV